MKHAKTLAAGETIGGKFESYIANNSQIIELEFADGLTAQMTPVAGQQYFLEFTKITSVGSATGIALW